MQNQELQLLVSGEDGRVSPLPGRYDHRLDPKRRFTIPLRWYERMGNPRSVYVVRGLTEAPCLKIFTAEDFEKRMSRYQNHSITDESVAGFLRFLAGNNELVDVDSQNRIRVSDNFLKHAGVTGDIALLGMVSHFEVWSLANCPKDRAGEEEQLKAFAAAAKKVDF